MKAVETTDAEFDLELAGLTKRFNKVHIGGVAIWAREEPQSDRSAPSPCSRSAGHGHDNLPITSKRRRSLHPYHYKRPA